MAHGLSGTRRDGLGPFAARFAEAGFSALVFDHRGFGDSAGEPDLFSPRRQLEDWRAAIAYARGLPGVDPRQVVTFGSSIGGGNALAAAADDPRVAAAVSQVPFIDLVTQSHRSGPVVAARMLVAAARGEHLPAVGSPSEAAFINAPAAEAGWRHVVAIGEDSRWRNRVSSRWLLGRPFRPVRHAARLHCPWLVCVGEADRVARPGPAIRAARAAPRGELRLYPGVDHFDIYDGPEFEAVVADEVDFLRRRLLELAP
jgi:pimeloyl-ACP methyl ester carboxylesterase